jgi:hypothetical protein
MRSSRSTVRSIGGLVLAVSLFAACGGASSAPVGAGVPAGASGAGQDVAASAAPFPVAGQPGSGEGSNAAPKDDAKIVRTGSLSVQVKDLDIALTAGRDAVRAAGGYIGASRQTNDGDNSVASVTYRIPSDRWDESLTALRGLGKVLGEQTDAIEVTGQLVDLQARIANLRASEQALQGIAARATKISDVLEVESRLTEVRGQIEQLDGQRAHLADQAGLGTLTVTYGLQVVAVTQATKGWNAGEEVDRASATLVDILQSLARAGIWLGIVWLPILVTLGILAAIAAFVLRRLGFLRRSETPAPPAAPATTAS